MAALNQHSKTQEDFAVEPARDQTKPAWDRPEPPGTSGIDRVTSGAGRAIYAIIAVAVFAFALVNALSAAYDAVRRGGSYDLKLPLLWELTSGIVIIALAPLIDFGVRAARRKARWPVQALWVAGTLLLFSVLHILGMVALRKLALGISGHSYSFGLATSESIYEFRKDVLTFFLIGLGFWLRAGRPDKGDNAQPLAAEASPASPHPVLWLRDGPARIRVEPHDIVQVTSAGNYVEYCMADGRTHLIRGTLAAEEARLAPFNIVRVHRTRLISLSRVSALQSGPSGDFELTLDTGQTVSGSRRYRGAVVSVVEAASVPASSPNPGRARP